jgi:hypothetical protein
MRVQDQPWKSFLRYARNGLRPRSLFFEGVKSKTVLLPSKHAHLKMRLSQCGTWKNKHDSWAGCFCQCAENDVSRYCSSMPSHVHTLIAIFMRYMHCEGCFHMQCRGIFPKKKYLASTALRIFHYSWYTASFAAMSVDLLLFTLTRRCRRFAESS